MTAELVMVVEFFQIGVAGILVVVQLEVFRFVFVSGAVVVGNV